MLRRIARSAMILLAAAATACTPFDGDGALVVRDASVPDAPTPDPADSSADAGPDAPACSATQPFGAPVFVEGLADDSATVVAGLRLSPDGLTGYYSANPADEPGASPVSLDLFAATRSDPAGPFAPVVGAMGPGINTPADEGNPTVSGDGLLLVFDRAYAGEPSHLYYARRSVVTAPFAYAGLLPVVNDLSASDFSPFLREDGQALYFVSTRNTGGTSNLYRAERTGSAFGEPAPVAVLDVPPSQYAPVVSPDELTIYFGVIVSAGPNTGDIWRAARASASDPFSAPTRLAATGGATLVSPTFVTGDDCTLYLSVYTPASGTAAQYVAERPGP